MSWTSKEKQRNFEIANAANGVEVYFEDQEECYDDHEKCNEYEALCPKYKILRQRCKLTCGTCNRNPPAPPINCTRSRFVIMFFILLNYIKSKGINRVGITVSLINHRCA